MDRRTLLLMTIAGLATSAVSEGLHAEEHNDPALIKSMADAKITLQQGLTAAAQQGRPISAKFEMEDGKLQLSVYTSKDGTFSEVIVDHETGKIAKTVPITEGEDLAAARSQSAAMAKAKSDLESAVDKSASGARAISVTPALKGGHASASVIVLKGQQFQTTEQSLE
jgi:hypothetical protein